MPPERLEGFLGRFADRHGELAVAADPSIVVVTAEDGSVAECLVPFPPLDVDPGTADAGLVAHALTPRRVGVLLVRRGGFAAGVFDGTALVTSKVGARHVQGRAAAGGWSQQRFARRRQGQTRVALEAAADAAADVLIPVFESLHAVVAGGDRAACDQVLADQRLRPLQGLVQPVRLDVPDPRRAVLEAAPQQFRAVRVHVTDVAIDSS